MMTGQDAPRRPRQRLGKDGLSYFQGLVCGAASDWTLEKASLVGQKVDFSLVKDARRLEFELARGPGTGARLSARHPREELLEEERRLAQDLSLRLAAADFVDLLARLRRDCLLYSDPDGGSVPSRYERYFRVVDHSPDYWKFIYPETRFLEEEVRFAARYAHVGHATLECRLANPKLSIAPLRFFAEDRRPARNASYADTAIGEADVVGGRTQAILGRTLERVAREEKPAFIHLQTTCLPELVGDNPAPFIARIERELGVPVLWTSKTRASGPVYEAMIERILDGAEFSSSRDPRAVLLAGVPTEESGREAAELCEQLGLRVVGTLLPNLDLRHSPEMGTASAVLWLNPVGWDKIEDGPFLRKGLSVVRYHPPFGLSGTQGWIERVAAVLGLEGGARAYGRARKKIDSDLEPLVRKCRSRTIALIGDRADIELLTSQGRVFGFSAAGLLGELGFNVRCLVCSGGAGARTPRRRMKNGAGTIEFVPFESRARLDRLLSQGIDLAFSHFNHDPRLEAHGILSFTDKIFEPGLRGLLRTGRSLLRKCAARPFPRHRALLPSWDP